MRGFGRGRIQRPPVTERHFELIPLPNSAGIRRALRVRATTAQGNRPFETEALLPDFVLDPHSRLSVRSSGPARLHRLGRVCELSADRALVVLDGDVIESGGFKCQVRMGATWRFWQDAGAAESRNGRWPAAIALAACLGLAPVASAQTAGRRDRGAATTQAAKGGNANRPKPPVQMPSPEPNEVSSATGTSSGDAEAKSESSSPLGRLVVRASPAQLDMAGSVLEARLVGLDTTVDQSQSSTTSELVFESLPAGKYRLTVVRDGGPQGLSSETEVEIAAGETTQAEVELSAPPPHPFPEMLAGVMVLPPDLPSLIRPFGNVDHLSDAGESDGEFSSWLRRWPSRLVRRPLSPLKQLLEVRAAGDIDLGAGHPGSPIRIAPALAYGITNTWAIVFDTRQGICANGDGTRCERRFDQLSIDGVYVLHSASNLDIITKAGLATGPFDPFALNVRAGGAAKALFDWFALQLELLAQVPVNQRDTVPIIIQVPAQLQAQFTNHLAIYLTGGFRGAFVGGQRDLTMPAGAGLLLGWRAVDLAAEFRFPRMLGTDHTLNERSLILTTAFRRW